MHREEQVKLEETVNDPRAQPSANNGSRGMREQFIGHQEVLELPEVADQESLLLIIIHIFRILAAKGKLILGLTVASMVVAAICVTLLPNTFKAEAVILPPQQAQSSLAAFSAGMLGGIAGPSIAAQLGLKDPADLYIGILKSRSISEQVASRFHLKEKYHLKFISDTRSALMKHVAISKSKESFIVISVEDRDPRLASELANAFVDELYKQNSRLAITDAAHRRMFFDQALSNEKSAMNEAELDLKNSQMKTGLIVPSGQTESLVRAAAELRAEISSRQIALQSMRSYATDQNSQVQLIQQEIAAARAQLSQLETSNRSDSDFELSARKLPEASLEYLRRMRNLKYHEALYEVLAKQYEAARIDEAKEAPVLQVLDPATVPERKSGPARLAITLLVGLLVFVLSSMSVYAVDVVKGRGQLLNSGRA